MKKDNSRLSAVLSIAFLATILATLILPIVQGIETHGHYTITEHGWGVTASRCDHLVDPPGADPDNAFTGCGIQAFYNEQDDAYINATYTFMRGFGGPDQYPHTWCCTGFSMSCGHKVDDTTTYSYSYLQPYYQTTGWNWSGYYQPLKTVVRTGLDAEKVGAITGSYFKNHTGANPIFYISSIIQSYDMYAGNPNEKNETF
jgi:hypothetical protein